MWFVMYWVYQTIERLKEKLTKAGRKYHKPFSNDQAMTGCIPQPLVQLFTSFFRVFFYSFLQFFFNSFFRFLQFFTRPWNGPVTSVPET